jgi:hypothetical protein
MQLDRIPIYVPVSAPSKILIIGKAMSLFRHHNRVAGPERMYAQHVGATSGATLAGPDASGGDAPGQSASVLITEDDIKGFSAQLCELAGSPIFSGAAMARTIDIIHGKVCRV